MMLETHIGDVEPWTPAAGFLGEPLPAPQWFILTVMSQKERGAAAKLERFGLSESWYPTEPAWKPQRGSKQRVQYDRAIAPGYLFVLTDRLIHWHLLFEMMHGFVTGVVGDEAPRVIPERVIANMRLVPKRIEILRDEETAREKADRLKRAPVPGGDARFVTGPFAGVLVSVQRIDRGIAAFLTEGGVPGTAAVDKLERVAPQG